ncbi:MAG: hypothetical protein ISS58_08055 [Dehalococcoidales bacterium]|nr:hypothetical protein [Dehalococcoidales bacterium]
MLEMNGFIAFTSIIGTIVIGLIAGNYLIVPLLLYALDTIAFLAVKILKKLPINTHVFESPEQSTIQSKCRVYNPNPLNYLLNRIPITPEEVAHYFNDCDSNPSQKDTLDVSFNPVIKKANRRLFKYAHPSRIISKVKR